MHHWCLILVMKKRFGKRGDYSLNPVRGKKFHIFLLKKNIRNIFRDKVTVQNHYNHDHRFSKHKRYKKIVCLSVCECVHEYAKSKRTNKHVRLYE